MLFLKTVFPILLFFLIFRLFEVKFLFFSFIFSTFGLFFPLICLIFNSLIFVVFKLTIWLLIELEFCFFLFKRRFTVVLLSRFFLSNNDFLFALLTKAFLFGGNNFFFFPITVFKCSLFILLDFLFNFLSSLVLIFIQFFFWVSFFSLLFI